jgi:hypothetical protein
VPKLVGVRERRHQPFYDTLFRHGAGGPTQSISRTTRLFASGTQLSNTAWTNMNMAGALPSDNTFIILSIRCWMMFKGSMQGFTALDAYLLMVHQLYLNLFVGDKPQFLSPSWYFPAGGGIDADIGAAASPALNANNGVPSQESILKLAKPIPVPARQHFYVEASFYDTGAISVLDQILNINGDSLAIQECKVMLDGIHTRDVQ